MLQKRSILKAAMKWGVISFFLLMVSAQNAIGENSMSSRNQHVSSTGYFPRYPRDSICPTLTSLHGSSANVDGSKRENPHVGVTGGRMGDAVIAPADGHVIAIWETNFGWGIEWNVLIQHAAADLNLSDEKSIFYSEFSHFYKKDLQHLRVDQAITRGQPIGRVHFPGGNPKYHAEVHWEVYEVPDIASSKIIWIKNESGFDIWQNNKARPVDPLYMLSLHQGISSAGEVRIVPFTTGNDYSEFKGFSYIFECKGPPYRGQRFMQLKNCWDRIKNA